jgi:alpha-tubulin suppressor-like RCC1 family protein
MSARRALFGFRVAVGLILLGGSITLGLASGASSSGKARAVGLETTGVTQVSAGSYHTCALLAGGAVKCWGGNFEGQLGDSGSAYTPTPVDVVGLS